VYFLGGKIEETPTSKTGVVGIKTFIDKSIVYL
jgi:hypothetical protein